MEALRQHKIKKKRQQCMLMWFNYLVYVMMFASMIISVKEPLINIYLFLIVLTSTWIMDIICIRRIQSHMKQIGTILPNKGSVMVTQVTVVFQILQYLTLACAQIYLIRSYHAGYPVFEWSTVTDAKTSRFITIYLWSFCVGSTLCVTITYINMRNICAFVYN